MFITKCELREAIIGTRQLSPLATVAVEQHETPNRKGINAVHSVLLLAPAACQPVTGRADLLPTQDDGRADHA